jgi:hypothetical protein
MSAKYEREDAEALKERLIRVENALFCLQAKSKCFPCWDNTEVERLERLRSELRARCESALQRRASIAS